jgi:hypothetical protein
MSWQADFEYVAEQILVKYVNLRIRGEVALANTIGGSTVSRSRRKTSIAGSACASSEKHDKQIANRRDRRVNREILAEANDDTLMKDRKASGDPWVMSKDGKRYFNPKDCPDLMRK